MTSANITVKTRQTGARATAGRTGNAEVVSATGGKLEIVTAPSQPGFNPLDLLHASLAACMVLSTRIAAAKLGLLDRLETVEVDVTGEKAPEGASRLGQLNIAIAISGEFDEATRNRLAHAAEEICTVSNTLKELPQFNLSVR